jgi:ABC-2 type transport system permease protein
MTTTTPTPGRVRRRPSMTSWRLEWLRLTRTRLWIALLGVYLVFGMLGPVVARYMAQLVQGMQSEITIIVPPPQPKDGVVNYLSQVGQIGLIVVVVIAAGGLTLDAHRGLSTFLRTRVRSMWRLVLPRVVVPAVAAVVAYAAGLAAAWYGTALLLGPLPAGPMLAGLLCESLYLAFVVAVVAAAASVVRTTLATVGVSLGALIALSIAGTIGAVHLWLPTTLAGAPPALLGTATILDYLPAMAVSMVSCVALVALAVHRLQRREI